MCVFLDYFADLISRTIWQVDVQNYQIVGSCISYTNAKSEKGSARMKQILIVEDDTTMNKMLSNILLAEGYKVTSVYTATEQTFNISADMSIIGRFSSRKNVYMYYSEPSII